MVTDEITIEKAIDKVLEKYPSFKGAAKLQEEETQKGFKIGAGAENLKGNADDALAAIFGNK